MTVEKRLQLIVDRLEKPRPRRSVQGYIAKCPSPDHKDNSPSFTVFINKHGSITLYCFRGCKTSEILQGLDLEPSDIWGSKQKGLKDSTSSSRPYKTHYRYDKRRLQEKHIEYPDWSKQVQEYQRLLAPNSLGDAYLRSRGIPYEIAKQYGLGYCPENEWCHVNKKGKPTMVWKFGRITVPHTTPKGRTINIYSRAIGEESKIKNPRVLQYFQRVKHAHLPGAKGVFNGQALQEDTVFLCEGVFDALSLICAGYPNTIALFGVNNIPWDWIQAKRLIFCLDNDATGSKVLHDLALQAVLRGKQVLYLDKSVYRGLKDLNEVWCQYRTLDLGTIEPSYKSTVVMEESSPTIEQEVPTAPQQTTNKGYYAVGSNQSSVLQEIKEKIIQAGVVAFDYESNSDPNLDNQDPQDTQVVGVSLSWELGHGVYLPIAHQGYEHNWNREELFTQFLKPILLHPDVTIVSHNIKIEQIWSILNDVNLYPKALANKAVDTMILVKALALPETIRTRNNIKTVGKGRIGDVVLGLKPLTKVLLADTDGYVHDLIHVDDIQSFEETVGFLEWEEPDPEGRLYKSGKNKGKPRMIKKKRLRRFDELPVDQQTINYACSDADWTLGLYKKLMPIARREGLEELVYQDTKRMMILGEYELSGWHIDTNLLHKYQKQAQQRIPQIEHQLTMELKKLVNQDSDEIIIPAGKYPMGKHKQQPVYLEIKHDRPFEWNSGPCLQWLLFHVLKLPTEGLQRTDKQGLPSVSADNIDKILKKVKHDIPLLRLWKEKRNLDKITSTYVVGLKDFVREDTHKLHTQLGVVTTWRYHSRSPNLQNIPNIQKDPFGIRDLFTSPTYDPNKSYDHLNVWTRPTPIIQEEQLSGDTMWIGADYSQLELRVLAIMAREQKMINAFLSGHDLHSATAKDVFNLSCTVEEVANKYPTYRKQAKAINFGLAYGITPFGLSHRLNISLEEAEQLINQYFDTYPNIQRYMKKQVRFAKQNGYVETLLRRRCPILRPLNGQQVRKVKNYPIQGGGADITTHSMIIFRDLQENIELIHQYQLLPSLEKMGLTDMDYLQKLVRALKAIINIHDELIFECPVEYVVDGTKLVKSIMEAPIKGVTDVVPMIADPAVGKRWSHLLDLHWDDKGTPYVEPKSKKEEPEDVTIDEIQYAIPLYKKAGIDVRVQ